MIGNPDEDYNDIKKTEEFIHHLQPDYLHATVFTPFPATPLYEEWKKITETDPWLEYAKHPTPEFRPPTWLAPWAESDREYMLACLEGIYRRFYLSPNFIARRIWDWRKWSKYWRAGLKLLAGIDRKQMNLTP